MSKSSISSKQIAYWLSLVVATILVLLPFHAFFTTWLGATFGSLDWFRIWKELLIIVLSLGVLWLLVVDKKLRKKFVYSFIVQLVLLYCIYSLLRGLNAHLSGAVNTEALLFGLVVNLRYFVFFVVVWVIAQKSDFLYNYWQKIVLTPAVVVVLFGCMQQFLLEKDFLRHFGYSLDTVPAFQAVDNKPEYARLQSTLRGPNPLGAYLSMIITFLVGLFLRRKNEVLYGLAIVVSSIVLFFTYSRSAWLGLVVGVVTLLFISNISKKFRVSLLVALLVGIVLFGGFVFVARDNDFVQNTVFHSDENSAAATSSNEVRFNSITDGVKEVINEPLGRGVGSAGPASMRNDQPGRIAENYYIQIAQEVGFIGLLLYIAISFMVAKELWWRHRKDLLARVLLASFAGITVINMVSHAWADDTLSLLWWGLAAIAIAQPVILKPKNHEKV